MHQGSLLQNLTSKIFLMPVFRLPQLHHGRTLVPVAVGNSYVEVNHSPSSCVVLTILMICG